MEADWCIDLTMSSESDVPPRRHWISPKPRPTQQAQYPNPLARRPISPPALGRSASSSGQAETISMVPASLPGASFGGARKPGEEAKPASKAMRTSTNGTFGSPHKVTSPVQNPSQPTHRTPKHQTPKKPDWTAEKIEQALRDFTREMDKDSARNAAHSIYDAWKKMAPKPVAYSKKNWFSDMKRVPDEAGKGTLKLKLKACPRSRAPKGSILAD